RVAVIATCLSSRIATRLFSSPTCTLPRSMRPASSACTSDRMGAASAPARAEMLTERDCWASWLTRPAGAGAPASGRPASPPGAPAGRSADREGLPAVLADPAGGRGRAAVRQFGAHLRGPAPRVLEGPDRLAQLGHRPADELHLGQHLGLLEPHPHQPDHPEV